MPARMAAGVRTIPVLIAVLYAALFAVRAGDFVSALYRNADVASGPVIAQALGTGPGPRTVVLGNYPWAEALWLQRAIDALTGSRAILVAGPFVLWAIALALLGFTVQRVTGDRWRTLLGIVIVVAAGPAVWATYASWTIHGLVLVHLTLLGAFWGWLTAGERGRRGLAVGALAGVLSGIGTASDLLVVPAALVPLAGAALLWRGRVAGTRAAAGLCVGLALVCAVLTRVAMGLLDVRAAGGVSVGPAAPGQLADNAGLLGGALLQVFDAEVARLPFGGLKLAHLCALAVAVSWAALCAHALWMAVRAQAGNHRQAHVLFWGFSSLSLLVGFMVVTAAVDVTSSRYLVGVLFAAGALVPVCGEADSRLTRGVAASVGLYALVGVVGLARGEFTVDGLRAPDAEQAHALARYAARQDVGVFYAGYWDAMPLTWNGGGIEARPVEPCPATGGLCPFRFHRISTWYRPRPGVRSAVVLDRRIRASSLTALPPGLGPPASSTRIGQLEVFVFDRDIAGGFGPPTGDRGGRLEGGKPLRQAAAR